MLKQVHFSHFKPTWEFEKYVNTTLSFVLGLTPYGTVGNLLVERSGRGGEEFICFVEVLSRWGRFVNRVAAECPREAFDQACLNIRNQIHRFSQELTPSGV